MSAMVTLRAELKKAKDIDVRDGLKNSLEELKREEDKVLRRALDHLLEIFPDMYSIDDDFRSNIEELRDEKKSPSIKYALDNMIEKVDWPTPDEIQKILLRLCDVLFHKFLKLSPKQNEVVDMFEISSESLKEVERLLSAEFTKGLEREGEDVKVKMFVTHIHDMPKKTEKGEFLVVDLRVNHLRVLHIIIIKGSIKKKDCKEFYISEDTKSSSYGKLFDFIVNSIAKFKKDRKIEKELPIGFTFPFPTKHESLTHGKLIRWTRDFKVTGAEGKDVVQLLEEAASRRGDNMEINVVALINDTTGILLSVGNGVPDCHIGLSLGDGANACYMEEIRDIPKFSGDHSHTRVIVNTEWGAFGDDGNFNHWKNYYDRLLDENSSNREQQIFGKMISDKYQGRIVYLILKDLISKRELFGGQSSDRFKDFKEFSTQKLSTMEGWDIEKCKELFKNRFGIEASIKDCEVIRRVCEAVSTRAARLAAAGIVALVKKIKKTDSCTVAVDGSLYKREPFPERLRDALDELAPRNNIKMKLTEDGPSIGAAFAAAMNYHGSPPSLSPRSPSPGGSVELEEPQELTYVNIEDQGRHPAQVQAQTGDIELPQIIVL